MHLKLFYNQIFNSWVISNITRGCNSSRTRSYSIGLPTARVLILNEHWRPGPNALWSNNSISKFAYRNRSIQTKHCSGVYWWRMAAVLWTNIWKVFSLIFFNWRSVYLRIYLILSLPVKTIWIIYHFGTLQRTMKLFIGNHISFLKNTLKLIYGKQGSVPVGTPGNGVPKVFWSWESRSHNYCPDQLKKRWICISKVKLELESVTFWRFITNYI